MKKRLLCLLLALLFIFTAAPFALALESEYPDDGFGFDPYGFQEYLEIEAMEHDAEIEAFNLNAATTRERAAVFLVMGREPRLFNDGNIPAGTNNRFNDVPESRWSYPSIRWAATRGWILGIGDGNFAPDRNVTREEYAVMLVRAFSSPLHSTTPLPFTDRNQISSWAVPYIRRAIQTENRWILGHEDGSFRPQDTITRNQAMLMTERAVGTSNFGANVIFDPATPRTITWNGNGAANAPQWQRMAGHALGAQPPRLPTRANHYFDGWGTATTLSGGTEINRNTRMPNANTTYWARWYMWHSNENWAGFWPGAINVRTETLGTVSAGFRFDTRVTTARNAWSSALGVPINAASANQTAQIRAFGGSREEIERFRRIWNTDWAGFAEWPTGYTNARAIFINGVTRQVVRFSGHSRIFVVERFTGVNWTVAQGNETTMTTMHELGHALGWWGHSHNISVNNQDIMWYRVHQGTTLRPNEIRHLAQFYARLR